jgi:hypothetical protein
MMIGGFETASEFHHSNRCVKFGLGPQQTPPATRPTTAMAVHETARLQGQVTLQEVRSTKLEFLNNIEISKFKLSRQ